MMQSSVKENVFRIRKEIQDLCHKFNRDPSEIQLVGVTKYVDPDRIIEASEAGLHIFAESYIQEAEKKIGQIDIAIDWQLIGHLQKNKVNKALRLFNMIQSVDSVPLAEKIDASISSMDRSTRYPVLLEVNIAAEPTKYGFLSDEIEKTYSRLKELKHIDIGGFMTLAPYSDDPEDSRPYFKRMYQLREELAEKHNKPSKDFVLSMGMSNDYLVAIEEGSTMLRIGSAIFGERG